jgi:hypothetical protein
MVRDPRGAVGDFIWSWMVYGFKGLRYIVSSDYRARVHAFWRDHPGRRSHDCRKEPEALPGSAAVSTGR